MIELNERQKRLTETIVLAKKISAKKLAESLNCSTKTIYTDLDTISQFLKTYGVEIVKKPRVGILLKGSINEEKIIQSLHHETNLLNSKAGRKILLWIKLLNATKPLNLATLSEQLFIPYQTINQYLDEIDKSLMEIGGKINRTPRVGITLVVTEDQKRKILFKILSRYWEDHWVVKKVGSRTDVNYQGLTNSKIIPDELVQESISLLEDFCKKNKIILSDYQFQSLAIHIAIAVQRITAGNLINDTKDMFNIETQSNQRKLAASLAKEITNKFNIEIPNSEISYLQMHLMASNPKAIHINDNNEISKNLKVLLSDTGYDEELLSNLYVHLLSTIKRLKVGTPIINPYKNNILHNYHEAFNNAVTIAQFFSKKYDISFNDDEIAYIAMHIEAYYERVRTSNNQLNVAIVCSTGLGSAQLLAARVRHKLPELNIVGIWSVNELRKQNLSNIQVILSTLNLEIPNKKVFIVSPLLDDQAEKEIQKYISGRKRAKRNILELIDHRLIFINPKVDAPKDVINLVAKKMTDLKYVDKDFAKSAIEREKFSSTGFGFYALPHGAPKYVRDPVISIITFRNGLIWGKAKVNIAIFIAFPKTISQEFIDDYFDNIYALLVDKKLVRKIAQQHNYENILKVIKEKIDDTK
jgi:transcriptional antiterminator